MPDPEPILLLPGLGADTRMFDPLRRAGLDIHTPPWIPPLPRESLTDYAARLALTMPAGLTTIGGASFGGMLALELARLLAPRAVILLGSAAHPSRLTPGAALLERFTRPIPGALARRLVDSGLGLRLLGATTHNHRALLMQMAHHAPISFIRWGARAIMHWPGVDPASLSARLVIIHGAHDRLIRPPIHPRPHLVPGAGHILPITHPDQVASLIRAATPRPGSQRPATPTPRPPSPLQ